MFRSKRTARARSSPRSTETPMHNFAGRVGQWSANHWKTAVLAWLIFVVGAVFVGNMVGTKQIKQNEATVGESHKADRILPDAKFTVDKNGESVESQSQTVLIQSKTSHRKRSRLPGRDRRRREDAPHVPAGHDSCTRRDPRYTEPDLISKDKHAARIDFMPKGTYEEAVLYIDKIDAAVDKRRLDTATCRPRQSV